MNIRIIRRRNGDKEVLAELIGTSQDELPKLDDRIYFDDKSCRVLTITKSYEVDKWAIQLDPDCVPKLDRICWFEVDIT